MVGWPSGRYSSAKAGTVVRINLQPLNGLSIPYFKKMKALVAEITPQLTLSSDKNKELSEKCSVLIADLVSK